jgi:hypothetical protein
MDDVSGNVLLWGAVCFVALERFSRLSRGLAPVRRRWLTNIGLLLLGGGLARKSIRMPRDIGLKLA